MVVSVGYSDGEGISFICAFYFCPWQQNTNHMQHLIFIRMTITNNGFFNKIWGIFTDFIAIKCRDNHGNAAGLAEL